jgi:hypothetical protein
LVHLTLNSFVYSYKISFDVFVVHILVIFSFFADHNTFGKVGYLMRQPTTLQNPLVKGLLELVTAHAFQ